MRVPGTRRPRPHPPGLVPHSRCLRTPRAPSTCTCDTCTRCAGAWGAPLAPRPLGNRGPKSAHVRGTRGQLAARVPLTASRVLLCPTRDECAERREVAGPAGRALSHYPEPPPPPEPARAAPCRRTVRPSRNPSGVCVAERVASLSKYLEGRFLQTGKPGRGERLALNHL